MNKCKGLLSAVVNMCLFQYDWLSHPGQYTALGVCLSRDESPRHLPAWGNFLTMNCCVQALQLTLIYPSSFSLFLCLEFKVILPKTYTNRCLSLQLHQQSSHPQRTSGQWQNPVPMRDLHANAGKWTYWFLKNFAASVKLKNKLLLMCSSVCLVWVMILDPHLWTFTLNQMTLCNVKKIACSPEIMAMF